MIADLDLPLFPSGVGSLSGTVTDQSGTPLADASVFFWGAGRAQSQSWITDATGTFVFSGLPSGPFSISISAPGFDVQWVNLIVQPGEDIVANVVMLPVPTGMIIGTVVDSLGAPVTDSLYVQATGGPIFSAGVVDGTGGFTIENLPDGQYTLSTGGPLTDFVRATVGPITVTQGAPATVQIVLEERLPISMAGTVRDTAGDPILGICVSAPDAAGEIFTDSRTDANGDFLLTDLEPGIHTLTFFDCTSWRTTRYATEYWGGATVIGEAVTFSLSWDDALTGMDATLSLGGTISGSVSLDAPGGPFVPSNDSPFFLERRVYRLVAGSWEPYFPESSYYGPTVNEYVVDGLPPGSYRVGFVDSFSVLPVAPNFWNQAESLGAARTIAIAADETITGVDGLLRVPQPGLAPAAVTDASLTPARERTSVAPIAVGAGQFMTLDVGRDLVGRWVSVWIHSGAGGTDPAVGAGSWQQVDVNGRVSVIVPADIEPGAHRVAVLSDASRVLGWRSIALNPAPAQPNLTAELGAPTGAGIPTSITIHVVGATGSSAPTGTVTLSFTAMGGPVQTLNAPLDALGNAVFAIPDDLPSGDYSVSASYSGDTDHLPATADYIAAFTVSQQGDEQFAPLSGVGAIPTENVMAGLSVIVTEGMDSPYFMSYLGSPGFSSSGEKVRTRDGGAPFRRPTSSAEGVVALSLSATGGSIQGVPVGGYVDFARSVAGPSASYPGADLTFIPFAKEALTYAVLSSSDFPRDIALGNATQDLISPAPFTLRNIYRGTVTTYVDAEFNTIQIRPIVPLWNTDTRAWWLDGLGLSEGSLGANVEDLLWNENDGTPLSQPGQIVPFSVAQYLAQAHHSGLPYPVVEKRSTVELGRIDTVSPYVNGVGGTESNPAFPISRTVFNVVETDRLTGTSLNDVRIQTVFAGSDSRLCESSATIVQYGYSTIGSACGNTTAYRQGYRF